MVSAQIAGTIKHYRVAPNGSKELVFSGPTSSLGTGGSSDGAIAQTQEKWLRLRPLTAPDKIFNVNDQHEVTFTPAAAATTDASDAKWSIPITYDDGTSDILGGGPDSTSDWDVFVLGDVALIANREYSVCARTVRRRYALGNDTLPFFQSIENNA